MVHPATACPKITVGLTCFNASQTIERALRSALAQDWPDLEVLVVDDCSTDDSWTILSAMALREPTLRLLRHDVNKGAAAARNTLLENAAGVFIVFFDDDDESAPQRTCRQYETLTAYERSAAQALVACYASGVRRYPNGYELEMPAIGSYPVVPSGEGVADYLLFNGRHQAMFYGAGTPTCALMARIDKLRSIGGFDPALRRVEDVDLAIRWALAGGSFVGTKEKLFVQYATVTPDKAAEKNLEAELRLVDKYKVYLDSKGRYDYARRWFTLRFWHFSGQRLRFFVALLSLLGRYPVKTTSHLLRSLPARWVHEKRMKKGKGVSS